MIFQIRYRCLLPVGHFLIDSMILVFWLSHGYTALGRLKASSSFRPPVKRVMLQEAGAPGWDFRHDAVPSAAFALLSCGNLPVAVVSLIARPHAGAQSRKRLWDPLWFLIHESLSGLLWFGIGFLVDRGSPRLATIMKAYLGARCLLTLLVTIAPDVRIGASLEVLFWAGLCLWGLTWSIRSAYRQLRPQGAI